MTDDRERLEHYLEWRRAADRDRAARRRRSLRSVAVVVAVGVVAGGLIAWLADGSGHAPARVATTTIPPGPSADVAPRPEASNSDRAPVIEERSGVPIPETPRIEPRAPGRASRAPQRSVPRVSERSASTGSQRSPPRVPPGSDTSTEVTRALPSPPPADEPAGTPDVVAAVAPSPAPAPGVAPSETAIATSESPAPAPPREALAPPPREAAVPDQAPPSVPSHPEPITTVKAPPTLPDRVASWLKGEVQEFRDGVKREIGEFSSGFDKVRGAILRRRATPPPER
jgi:nicotinate-nucleotide--dimethylbenzimidazole phosphoribosyltransferase